ADAPSMAPPLGLLRRVGTPALLGLLMLAGTAPGHAAGTSAVEGTAPTWANPGNSAGDAPANARMVFSVWLGWRNQGRLETLLAAPRIPVGLASSVAAITGLDNADTLARPQHRTPAPPPPTGRSVGPCSHYWDQRSSSAFPNPFDPGQPLPWLICGYTPAQIASA